MKVTFTVEATDDLVAVGRYIAERDPATANGVIDRLFAIVDRVAEGDFDGPEQQLRSGEHVRSWPVPPFRIYDRRERDELLVLRVYHQARRPIVR